MSALLLVDDRVRMYLKIIEAAKPTTAVIVFNRFTSSLDDIIGQIEALPARAFTSVGLLQDGTDLMADYRIVEGQAPCALHNLETEGLASWSPVITFLQSVKSLTGATTFDFISCLLGANPGFSYAISQISAQLGIVLQASSDRTGNLAQGGNWVQESDNVNIQDVYFTDAIAGYTGLLYTFFYKPSNQMIKDLSGNTGLVDVNHPVLGMTTFAPSNIYAWGDAAWGGTNTGSTSSPPTDKKYIAIASNVSAFAALDMSGAIYAWGDALYGGTGRTISPPTDKKYIAIASTNNAFAALRSDGAIYAWGYDAYGGNNTGVGNTSSPRSGKYIAIASNLAAFAALDENGAIYAWGDTTVGGTGILISPPSGKKYKAIASNGSAFAALDTSGNIKAWGHANYGGTNSPPTDKKYIAIASNIAAFAALDENGAIYAWGYASYGGTNTGSTNTRSPPSGKIYKAIASNDQAFAALDISGAIYAWGNDAYGGTNTGGIYSSPRSGKYNAITSNYNAFAALDVSGAIYAWGYVLFGGYNAGVGDIIGFTGAPQAGKYNAITSNYYAFAALDVSGAIYAWGDATYGGNNTGVGNTSSPRSGKYTAIASNKSAFAAAYVKTDSTILVSGSASFTYTGGSLGPATITKVGSTAIPTLSYTGTGVTTYGPTSTAPINAGLYNVTASVAEDADYNGNTSVPLAFAIVAAKPGVPQSPLATVSGVSGQATVSWAAPASNGGSVITKYTVYADVSGAPTKLSDISGSTTSMLATGLTNGTSYTFKITAWNVAGEGLPAVTSPAVIPYGAPDAPRSQTATVSGVSGQANVSWAAPAFDGGSAITKYTVTSDQPAYAADISGVTSATVTGLTNGTPYTFTISAYNGVTSSLATTSSVTPYTAPSVPQSQVATVSGVSGEAYISWAAPASDGGSAITKYTITSDPSGCAVDVSGGATYVNATGLTNGTPYTFTISAYNGVTSPMATTSSVTPYTAPSVPQSQTATVSGVSGQANISWAAPVSNGGPAITQYTVYADVSGVPTTKLSDVSGSTLSFVATGLTNGTSYTFKITAWNYRESLPAVTTPVTPYIAQYAPTNISASSPSKNTAIVKWDAVIGAKSSTQYVITILPMCTTVTVLTDTNSATLSNLKAHIYRFTVRYDDAGVASITSAESNSVRVEEDTSNHKFMLLNAQFTFKVFSSFRVV